jgi:hypothetical protein
VLFFLYLGTPMYMFGSANFNVASSMGEYSQQILLHLSKEQVKAFVKGQSHKWYHFCQQRRYICFRSKNTIPATSTISQTKGAQTVEDSLTLSVCFIVGFHMKLLSCSSSSKLNNCKMQYPLHPGK